MDDVMTISRSYANELRGFLNLFAVNCKGCLKRSYANCLECPCGRATRLMQKMDSSMATKTEEYFHKNPFVEHLACVIKAIREAGRPIFQREMKIDGTTRQSLHWDLKKMCQRGYIMRVATDFGVAYKIGPKKFRLPN